MANDRKHGYLEAGYPARLLISFSLAVALLLTVLSALPPVDPPPPRPGVKNVVIDLYNLYLEESAANGGGGGGGSAAPAAEAVPVERLRHAIPKPVPIVMADSSETIVSLSGDGQGSGIGGGQGQGFGNGAGDGAGDGIGHGRGLAAPDTLPPRPLVQVMPEQPRSSPDKKAVGVVRLRIRVNERGQVEQVEVVFNSTGSSVCEQRAIEAARHSRFQPARVKSAPVAAWTICEYGFDPKISR